MKRLARIALLVVIAGAVAALAGALAGAGALVALGGRAALLGLWALALLEISHRALYTGPGNVVGGLLAAFASGLVYGGLSHALADRSARAFLDVFTPTEWVPLGVTGAVALVSLWVIHAWIQSVR